MRDMSPDLSFQCSRSKITTSKTLDTSLTHPVCQWLLRVALYRVFPGGTQIDVVFLVDTAQEVVVRC